MAIPVLSQSDPASPAAHSHRGNEHSWPRAELAVHVLGVPTAQAPARAEQCPQQGSDRGAGQQQL